MPSPTPPRELVCEACGSSAPHSKEQPMPDGSFVRLTPLEAMRWLMATYGCCISNCTGCWPRRKT
jgi:hypothetical protein